MKKHELVFVVCRILAIYVFIRSCELLQSIIFLSSSLRDSQAQNMGMSIFSLVSTIVWCLSLFVIAIVFWKKSNWLSSKIFPTSDNENVFATATVDSLFTASIMIIGLWIFAMSIPKCVNTLVRLFYFKEVFTRMNMVDNLSCFVQLIIGMFMTFGPNMIAGFIRGIRKLGSANR